MNIEFLLKVLFWELIFDQWGVELGKVLAEELTEIIEGEKSKDKKDGSTQMLLSRVAAYKKL